MTNRSPLRQLAHDYYNGRVDRASYLKQRHSLIDALSDSSSDGQSFQHTTIPGVFQALSEGQLDSTDLSNAFAKRHENPVASNETTLGGSLIDLQTTTLRSESDTPTATDKEESAGRDSGSEEVASSSGSSGAKVEHPKSTQTLSKGRQWLRATLLVAGGLILIILVTVFL